MADGVRGGIGRPARGHEGDGDRDQRSLQVALRGFSLNRSLSGQQRLTALWRGLNNNYDDRTYFLVLKPNAETGLDFDVESISRWSRPGDMQPRPFWANRPKEQWQRRMVPLELCAPNIDAQQKFRDWLREAIEPQAERDELSDQIAIVRQIFASFNLPFLSLPVTTKKGVALEVFIKMNTAGVALSIFDIIVAQVEAGLGQSLHDLLTSLRAACPLMSEYYPLEDLVLYASALLQGRAPTNATYMAKDFGSRLIGTWNALLQGVKRTVIFLEEERIFDAARLPSDVVIPVLVALWSSTPQGLDAEGRARMVLRKYLWRAFFTNRYESSTNSRALSDLNDLKPLVEGTGLSNPTIFDGNQHPLPQLHVDGQAPG
jgi:Protein of unknown function DUF262